MPAQTSSSRPEEPGVAVSRTSGPAFNTYETSPRSTMFPVHFFCVTAAFIKTSRNAYPVTVITTLIHHTSVLLIIQSEFS